MPSGGFLAVVVAELLVLGGRRQGQRRRVPGYNAAWHISKTFLVALRAGQWARGVYQGLPSPRWEWGCCHSTMTDSGWPSQEHQQGMAGEGANEDGCVDNGVAGDDPSLLGFCLQNEGPCAIPRARDS